MKPLVTCWKSVQGTQMFRTQHAIAGSELQQLTGWSARLLGTDRKQAGARGVSKSNRYR